MRTLLLFLSLMMSSAFGADSLNYSGRLVNSDGSPVTGPVNITFELLYTNAPAVVLCSKSATGIVLNNGVFHRKLDFTNAECGGTSLLSIVEATPANESIAIKLTDTTNSRNYAAQAVNAMPYSLMAQMARTLTRMGATTGQVLTWDGSQWAPSTVAGGGGAGSVTSIATGTGITGGPITTTGTISIATNGVTTTQIADGTIANIDVNSAAGIARTKLANGTASHVVVNDGSGVMSSVAQLPIAQGGTGAATAAGARTNLGLGDAAQATLGMVSGNAMRPNDVSICAAGEHLKMNVGPTYFWTCETLSLSDTTKVPLDGSAAMTGNLQLGTHKITGLGTPTVATDAATKGYIDAVIAGLATSPWTIVSAGVTNYAGDAQLDGKLRLKSTTANYVELIAPAGLAATRSFVLPGTLGSNGEVLTTDGTGNLSWSAASTGSKWTEASGDVYRSSGAVGIGTATPSGTLHVKGAASLVTTLEGVGGASLSVYDGSALRGSSELYLDTIAGSGGDIMLRPRVSTAMIVKTSGDVGIGTIAPTSKLDVKGELRLSGVTSGYVGFAPAATAGSTTYTLPSADGSSGHMLSTNGSGVLSWAAAPSAGAATMGGDLTGTVSNAQIAVGAVTYAETNFADGDIPLAKINGLTTGLTGKEPTIAAGTSAQYWRGDKTWQTLNTAIVPESGNLYFLDSRVRNSLMSGYSIGSALPLAATDTLIEALAKLEGSLAAIQTNGQWTEGSGNVYRTTGRVGVGTATPTEALDVVGNANVTGSVRLKSTTANYVELSAPAGLAATRSFILPGTLGASGEVLTTNGSGVLSWAAAPSAGSTAVGGDLSGTVTNAQIVAGGVSTTELADGSITNSKIAAAAAIDRTKLAAGTADHIVINNSSGVMASVASLPSSMGGTGLGSLTANRLYVANATGTALQEMVCLPLAYLAFDVSGNPMCSSLPIAASGVTGMVSATAQTMSGLKTFENGIMIGTIATACNGSTEGAIRYNSTSKKMEFCNGTTWGSISSGTVASVSIGAPSLSIVSTGTVSYVVTFGAQTDTVNLTTGMVSLSGTDTAGCAVGVTGSGLTRTVNVSGCSGTGTVAISLAAGSATSTTSDPSAAAGPSATFLADNSGPNAPTSVALGSVPSNLMSSPTISYTAATDVGGSTIANHQVRIIRTSDSVQILNWSTHSSGNAVTGLSLATNTQYSVFVRATDALGNIGTATAASNWTSINDPCAGSPSPGTMCLTGAIVIGTIGSDKYMTTPGGGQDIPAGQISGGSGVSSYALSQFTGSFTGGVDTLTKAWNNNTGSWYDIPSLINYTSSTGIGQGAINTDANDGSTNTATIVAITAGAQGGYHAAARYCDRLVYGYTDWVLPNRAELNLMWTNRAVIPGLLTNGTWYWSSTENDVSNSWIQKFDNGDQNRSNKTTQLIVRCVRKF